MKKNIIEKLFNDNIGTFINIIFVILLTLTFISPALLTKNNIDYLESLTKDIRIRTEYSINESKSSFKKPEIAVVLIDEKAVANDSRLDNQSYTSREYLAELLRKISLQNPKVIALNISLFTLKPNEDIYLKKAIDFVVNEKKQTLILTSKFSTDCYGNETELRPSEYFYKFRGKIPENIKFGYPGIRSYLEQNFYDSSPLEMIRSFELVKNIDKTIYYSLPYITALSFNKKAEKNYSGEQYIDFRIPIKEAYQEYSSYSVLNNKKLNTLENKIVFIGIGNVNDGKFITPVLSLTNYLSATELFAYITHNILENKLETVKNPFIYLIFVIISILLFLLIYRIFCKFKIKYFELLSLAIILVYIILVFRSPEIPMIPPISAWLMLYILVYSNELEEKLKNIGLKISILIRKILLIK